MLDVAIARAASAETLRAFALDESLKARVLADARLSPIASRIADRYIAGETLDQVFDRLPEVLARGHLASIEYTGESVRAAAVADAETEVFLELARRIQMSAVPSTVSFDLSHIGLTVDPELGYRNAVRLAEATAEAGTELIISAEGSARTDLVLDTLLSSHGSALAAPHIEFEMLLGLGTETLDELRAAGLRTREYLIFGTEWWLYVLNRIAENPDRVFQAITDAAG